MEASGRGKSWRGEEDRELAGRRKEGKPRVEEWAGKKDGKRQRRSKAPRKKWAPHPLRRKAETPRWKEGAKSGHDPATLGKLSEHKYQAPQGCSGVHECARQEGLAFFGMSQPPSWQQELASLLRTYLARLPWARQLTEELPLSPLPVRWYLPPRPPPLPRLVGLGGPAGGGGGEEETGDDTAVGRL